MLTKLAERALETLGDTSTMPNEDKELYVYGFYMIFSRMFFFLLTALFGLLFHILAESILFYLLFSLIRTYAGGVHASTEVGCTILTSLSFLMSVAMIKLISLLNYPIIAFVVLIVASTCILLFAPIDTLEKRLSYVERKRFQKTTYLILSFIIILAILTFFIRRRSMFYTCAASLGLEGILLFTGYFKNSNLDRHTNLLSE